MKYNDRYRIEINDVLNGKFIFNLILYKCMINIYLFECLEDMVIDYLVIMVLF